jgi:hypothetical protein
VTDHETDRDGWYDEKSQRMELTLGPEHDMVMHAIIPFEIGGGLDLYYYPKRIKGCAIATKELAPALGEGSNNDRFECYELVMFTRHALNLDHAKNEKTAFGKAHKSINAILNNIAAYSQQATLNPYQTCEFPREMDAVGGKCLIFDEFGESNPYVRQDFGLLAVIEVFRSEMNFAQKNGGEVLINLLKKAGHYPYSDLDRKPVA